MNLRLFLRLCLFVFAATASHSSLRAEFIDTIPAWNGSDFVFSFGETDTATYGQTITTGPTDIVLQDFSFLIRTSSSNPSNFEAFVMAWDSVNSRATGPVLFQSAPYSNPQSPNFAEISVPVGGLTLAPNTEYVLFFNASNLFDGNDDAADFANVGNLYAGGEFVFINNSGDFSMLTTDPWTTDWLGNGDLAFSANLVPVPEPASWALMIGGITLVASRRLRRRKA